LCVIEIFTYNIITIVITFTSNNISRNNFRLTNTHAKYDHSISIYSRFTQAKILEMIVTRAWQKCTLNSVAACKDVDAVKVLIRSLIRLVSKILLQILWSIWLIRKMMRRKNFTNWLIKECFKAFIALRCTDVTYYNVNIIYCELGYVWSPRDK